MFELDGVAKSYGGTRVLAPLDLIVQPRQTTVLIGPSGCGKSTLLRLMIGLIEPSAGTVRFEGAEVTQATAPMLRRRMGYVIQDGGLFPHLTARENACLIARFLRWEKPRIAARLNDLATLTHFPESGLERYPTELSGGQRQRVSLMRALMLDPDALLLDEPMGALDPMIRYELQDDLRAIFRTLGKTVVLVTHDIGEAGFFGDEILLMRDGMVVQKGPPAELLARPADAFVERFINAQRSPLDALRGAAR